MAKIETYALSQPSLDDKVIGTDVNDDNITKNFSIGDIVALANGNIPPSSVNLEYISYPLFGILTTNTGGTNAVVPLVDYLNAGLLSPTDYIKLSEFAVTATGPITSSGGNTPNISTLMNTNKLIGRYSAGSGEMEEITIGTGLSLTAGTLTVSGGSGLPKGTASGTDTYTTTISGVSSYVDGDAYLIRFTNGNTTGATLNINSLGAKILYRNNDGELIGGDITSGSEMLCVFNSTLDGFQCIGTAPNSLFTYVTNVDTVTITKGQAVYAFGGQGDRLTVKRAYNTSDATSAQTIGLVLSTSIGVNQKGLIILQGLLDGLSILPTATWADGDPVYLGATAGTITNVKPSAPNHLVYLGFVTTASNGSSGRLYVRPQNGYELQELHNVALSSPPNNNDGLFYESSTSLWKNKSIPTVLGYTPEPAITAGTTAQYWRGDKSWQTLDKSAVGLDNVDNTSDANKPVSTATQTALNLKVDANTAITGATKTKITYDSKGLVTAGSDATTADIAESTNKLYVSDGDKGDITVSGNGTIWTIDNQVVTFAKMQNVSTSTLFGRTDAGSGVAGSITIGTGLTGSASTLTANLSVGVNNGQSAIGGARASENLTLSSTSNATKGKVILGSLSAYDEANDRLGIGTTSPITALHVVRDAIAGSFFRMDALNGAPVLQTYRLNGTISLPTGTVSGNIIGLWSMRGHDGTNYVNAARATFAGLASENWTSTAQGAYIRFETTTNGTTTLSERLRIDHNGAILIGTTTNSGFKLDVNGTARVSTSLDSPILRGGTSAFENITISTTSSTSKGKILFGNSAYDEANNRLGIGTTSPTYTFDASGTGRIIAGSLINGGNNAFNITATMPSTQTFNQSAIVFEITSAGTHSFVSRALNINFQAGYTGNSSTTCINGGNLVAGTGTDFFAACNRGCTFTASATTTGTNVGLHGEAVNGNINSALFGRSLTAKNSATNIGASGFAINTGTSSVQVGGYFALQNAMPTFTSAALMCDNGTQTSDIFVARDNGTIVWNIVDGGTTTWSDAINISFGTTTGTKIGTATSQKLAFWNKTPIVQPTTGVAAAALVSNAGTTLTSTDTFDGYTLQQIVKALRDIGLLA